MPLRFFPKLNSFCLKCVIIKLMKIHFFFFGSHYSPLPWCSASRVHISPLLKQDKQRPTRKFNLFLRLSGRLYYALYNKCLKYSPSFYLIKSSSAPRGLNTPQKTYLGRRTGIVKNCSSQMDPRSFVIKISNGRGKFNFIHFVLFYRHTDVPLSFMKKGLDASLSGNARFPNIVNTFSSLAIFEIIIFFTANQL